MLFIRKKTLPAVNDFGQFFWPNDKIDYFNIIYWYRINTIKRNEGIGVRF